MSAEMNGGDVKAITRNTTVTIGIAAAVVVSSLSVGMKANDIQRDIDDLIVRQETILEELKDVEARLVGKSCRGFHRDTAAYFGKLFVEANRHRKKTSDPIVWPNVWDIPGPDGQDCSR